MLTVLGSSLIFLPFSFTQHIYLMKKALRETQTLRAKNFRPTTDPLPGVTGPPKFNQLETVTTCTYRPSMVKIDARNFELLR